MKNLKKKVSVSCDNKVIPGNNYLGEGKVNNKLYTNNKDSFEDSPFLKFYSEVDFS